MGAGYYFTSDVSKVLSESTGDADGGSGEEEPRTVVVWVRKIGREGNEALLAELVGY